MDINKIYKELDSLPFENIEKYLEEKIGESESSKDFAVMIPLVNEMIGFLRDTTSFDNGKKYKKKLLQILSECGQQDTMNEATSLLNIANFDRACGDYSKSVEEYKKCESIYEKQLSKEDYLWAGLFNNKSLLYQMMGDHLAAIGELVKALRIVEAIPERYIEVATTYTNIAQSLAAIGRMDEAKENVEEALKIFAKDNNRDYHYSAAAAVMGVIAYSEGDYKAAADYYEKAADTVKRIMGENDNYRLLISNRDAMLDFLPKKEHKFLNDSADEIQGSNSGIQGSNCDVQGSNGGIKGECAWCQDENKGIVICRKYYEQYGKAMIREKFASYENRIAVGLFGEGSDCMFLDDEISRDHDWGPGFMLLITKASYDEIGVSLQEEYEKLPNIFMGYSRMETAEAKGRVGVVIIEDMAEKFLSAALTREDGACHIDRSKLGDVSSFVLSLFTNGEIWKDDEGIISGIRQELMAYYDDNTWLRKLGMSLIRTGHTGQYNLGRVLKRGDRVTAKILLGEYMICVLKTLFLVNRTYAPYDKWLMIKGAMLPEYAEITDCLRAISDMEISDENVLLTIEIIAQIILDSLKAKGVVEKKEDNWYLEEIGKKILYNSVDIIKRLKWEAALDNNSLENDKLYSKEELVSKILKLEWEAFDKVENEGGRASCQNDFMTFKIMRQSQYMEWNEELLESFIYDFEEANKRGWNLITEKYGRMEISTAPKEYEKLKAFLPRHSESQDKIIEQIVAIQVGMMEEVANKFPKFAGGARTIHTSEDTEFNTSYETYLRGELGTYSEQTLGLYGRFIADIAKAGDNLAYRIMNNTAKLYGYKSIEDCESKM